MFNKEKIERLDRRIEYLEKKESDLNAELRGRRILKRAGLYGMGVNLPSVPAISLEELQTMQNRILDYIGVELKTTEAKTELVAKSLQSKMFGKKSGK